MSVGRSVGRSAVTRQSIRLWVGGRMGGWVDRSVSRSDGKSKLSHVGQSIGRSGWLGRSVRRSSHGLAPSTSSGAGPRCGTPRASLRPPGAPGGEIPVKPEVFLTPPPCAGYRIHHIGRNCTAFLLGLPAKPVLDARSPVASMQNQLKFRCRFTCRCNMNLRNYIHME